MHVAGVDIGSASSKALILEGERILQHAIVTTGAESVGSDEFVCSACFLVKRITQLADRRKTLCRDCV